jgi:hypothetical protein
MKSIAVDEELDAARQQLSLPRPETPTRPDPAEPT